MAQIFPKFANKVPLVLVVLVMGGVVSAVGFFWYFGSPQYTDVGYRPEQPIAFSHKTHAGNLGMDCRYCHNQVEMAPSANIPPTQTCMNCHTLILTDSEKLLPVRESWANKEPIHWIRVHKIPEYAYFDHAAHLRAGVGCISCHGNIRNMPEVTQDQRLSMGWCLECHHSPDQNLRPISELTNMEWTPPADHAKFVDQWKEQKKLNPPTDCSGCHR